MLASLSFYLEALRKNHVQAHSGWWRRIQFHAMVGLGLHVLAGCLPGDTQLLEAAHIPWLVASFICKVSKSRLSPSHTLNLSALSLLLLSGFQLEKVLSL